MLHEETNKMTTLIEQIQQEFQNLPAVFELAKQAVLNQEGLVSYKARHPLFQIDPFHDLLQNEWYTEEEYALLLVQEAEEINLEFEKLYEFWVDPKTQRICHRIQYYENNNRAETVFEYKDDYHKSLGLSMYGKRILLEKVCYLVFKNGFPDFYLECSHSGVLSKKYRIENNRVSGYYETHTFFSYTADAVFEYDASDNIDRIKRHVKYMNAESPRWPEVVFKRPDPDLSLETAFKIMEDFLVARITNDLLQRVRIPEEVYCLLLEYCMPEAFPPELCIGVVSDLESPFEELNLSQLYFSGGCRYESYEGTLPVDLYEEKMQEFYLLYYRAYDQKEYKKQTFEYWDERIKQLYLKVCQRLMHVDFSPSFTTSKQFLVLAKEGSNFDVEYSHEHMFAYKKEQNL